MAATNVGGLPDAIEDGRTGYIVEKENEKALADAAVRFLQKKMQKICKMY